MNHRLHFQPPIQFISPLMESSSSNSSNSAGGDQGTSSQPTRQLLNEGRPLRSSGEGAGGVSSHPAPRAIRPLTMGVPGVSAFAPYTRPPPPLPESNAAPSIGSGGIPGLPSFMFYNRAPPRPRDWHPRAGSNFGYGCGFFGSHMARGGGSGHCGSAPHDGGALRIGGSPAARKRGREEGEGSSAAAGRQQGERAVPYQVPCPICPRDFMSDKALFGHMRSHPNRGWKGVHPPPAFRAEEEFADVPGLNRPEEVAAAEIPAAAEGGGGEAEMQEQGGAEENYNVPDLNMPPPASPDQ